MVVPDEFALDLGELDHVAVKFARDARTPNLIDLREFLREVYCVQHGVCS